MSKYEIKTVHSMDHEDTFVIYSTEESAFFAGYDFMGSVNWVKIPSHECELTAEDDPEQIVKDLESADEPAEPATTALERCYKLGFQIEAQGWNRELYQELNETAYQSGIAVTESFEDGFFMIEDEVFYIHED